MCPLSDVLYDSFVAHGFKNNNIFDLSHPWNRDNCFQPYYLMREKLKHHGIEVNSDDVNEGRSLAFELHMDVQKQGIARPCYLLMPETAQVCPANGISLLICCLEPIVGAQFS